ncbi:MAG TPA: tyrosine-type recombinase/integrase [Dehalococcoidia bacterium]|nr:tyrosine-type recombinase/integrase [Dehalococcoidia bacterium]
MKVYVEHDEVAMMEKAASNLRDKILIRMLFHLGCRISEALGLTMDDVDFTQGTVSIKHLKTRLRLSCSSCGQRLGRSHTFCPKCGSKVTQAQIKQQEHRRQRVLPIDSDTLKMLKEYIDRGGPVVKEDKTVIFGINRHRAWQIVRQCAASVGLHDLVNPETGKIHGVSPHKIRDGFSVMAIQHDDSTDGVRMLQEWLGHANIGTTLRYRKVAGQELRDWYEKLWPHKEGDNG